MEENIFKSSAHQDEHDYIHDDTFQILDTNDYDVPENEIKKPGAEHQEMMDTMNLFNDRLDEVDCGCGIPDELTEDTIVTGLWENEERKKENDRKHDKNNGRHKKEKTSDDKVDLEQGSEFITQKSVCSESI